MERETGRLQYTSMLLLLITCGILLTTRLVYMYLGDPYRFPIATVKIEANYQHVTRKEFEDVLNKYLHSSFFLIPIQKLTMDLESMAWAKQVHVQRVWPDTLKITLEEKHPIARWNQEMLTEEGEAFRGDSKQATLPILKGPTNQQKEVLQVYQKMSKILAAYGLHVASLAWRDNQAWELKLTNGIVLQLGKRDIETRLTRFCRAFPAVFAERPEQLASVDLRYPRGMAVHWKK